MVNNEIVYVNGTTCDNVSKKIIYEPFLNSESLIDVEYESIKKMINWFAGWECIFRR